MILKKCRLVYTADIQKMHTFYGAIRNPKVVSHMICVHAPFWAKTKCSSHRKTVLLEHNRKENISGHRSKKSKFESNYLNEQIKENGHFPTIGPWSSWIFLGCLQKHLEQPEKMIKIYITIHLTWTMSHGQMWQWKGAWNMEEMENSIAMLGWSADILIPKNVPQINGIVKHS